MERKNNKKFLTIFLKNNFEIRIEWKSKDSNFLFFEKHFQIHFGNQSNFIDIFCRKKIF